jgi:general secretion pathway protein H
MVESGSVTPSRMIVTAPRGAVEHRLFRSGRRTLAFTLLEILLATALIGLLAAALVSTSIHLIGDRPVTPEDVFWQTVREARGAALKHDHDVEMRFDLKEQKFTITEGERTQSFPVPPPTHDLTVQFLPPEQGRNSVLVGGVLLENEGLPSVTFYADGTCTAFRVQFRATGAPRVIAIDPWTCAPVLSTKDSNS